MTEDAPHDGELLVGDASERTTFEKGAALVDMSGMLLLLCEGSPLSLIHI